MTQEVLELLQSPESAEAVPSKAAEGLSPLQGEVPPQGAEVLPPLKGEVAFAKQMTEGSRPPSLADARQPPFQGGQDPGLAGARQPPLQGGRDASPPPDPAIMSHLSSLRAQEAELRREIPEFRLEDALRDKDFLRLTSPTVGVSVRRAYFALHGAERERRAAEESARRLAQSVASGASRPREGGGQSGAALTGPDPRTLSAGQRQALKERIHAAAARGEKLYP